MNTNITRSPPRSKSEKLVKLINSFWRESGYDACARIIQVPGGAKGVGHRLVTALVNGLPPGFSSVEKPVADIKTVPLRHLNFARAYR
jgi:hypothetical protein